MARGLLPRLAILCAVALACPAVLGAAAEQPGASPTDAQPEVPVAEPPAAADPPTAEAPEAAALRAPAAPQEAAPGAPNRSSLAPPDAARDAAPAADAAVKAQAAESGSVTMEDFSFSPAAVTVDVGESVTWRNGGRQPHTATGDGFDTGTLRPGQSGSATFSRAGSFGYVCSIHPNMRGTVRVASSPGEERDAQQPPAGDGGGSEARGDSATSATPGEASQTGASGAGRATLPASGLDAWVLCLAGVALAAVGIALRRRTAER